MYEIRIERGTWLYRRGDGRSGVVRWVVGDGVVVEWDDGTKTKVSLVELKTAAVVLPF